MSGVIRWEEPPSPRGKRHDGRWATVADELRRRPRAWAVVAEENETRVSTIAQAIKKGVYKEFAPEGNFEAQTRTIRDGNNRKYVVYARYVGEAPP